MNKNDGTGTYPVLIMPKGGVDILNLPSFINPSHFLQNFIDIDLGKDGKNLTLDETTLMFMEIPAGADFQMDYTLAE